jgi:hypothetical protein
MLLVIIYYAFFLTLWKLILNSFTIAKIINLVEISHITIMIKVINYESFEKLTENDIYKLL